MKIKVKTDIMKGTNVVVVFCYSDGFDNENYGYFNESIAREVANLSISVGMWKIKQLKQK